MMSNQSNATNPQQQDAGATIITREVKSTTVIPNTVPDQHQQQQFSTQQHASTINPFSTHKDTSATIPVKQTTLPAAATTLAAGSHVPSTRINTNPRRVVHMQRDANLVDSQTLLGTYKLTGGKKAVIVGVDFADNSRRAVDWAVRHFGQLADTKLIFVHCYTRPSRLLPALSTTPEQDSLHSQTIMKDFECFMDRALTNLPRLEPNSTNAGQKVASGMGTSEHDMEAELLLVEGRAYNELCALAQSCNADAVVVGYSKRAGLGALMGSTSNSIVQACHACAVIVVK